jgi:hypothetical protein
VVQVLGRPWPACGFEAARGPAHGRLAASLVFGVQLGDDDLIKVSGDAPGLESEKTWRLASCGQFPDRCDPAVGDQVADGLFLALRDGLLFRGRIARSWIG